MHTYFIHSRWLGLICLAVHMSFMPQAIGQTEPHATSQFDSWRNVGLEAEDKGLLDSAVLCYTRAEEVAIKEGNKIKETTILNDLGIVHRKKADYVACKQYHSKAIEIALAAKQAEMVEMSFHGLGSLYEQTGDYDDAVACYLRTLMLTQERGDQEGVIITRQNLAKTYMRLMFKDASTKEIELALQAANKIKQDSLSANVLHDYAEILLYFKDYSQALVKMEAALDIYEKIGYKRYIGSSLVYLGDIYQSINQAQHAFSYFEKALVYKDNMDKDVLADLYIKIGDFYYNKKDVDIAKVYFEKSHEISKQNTFKALEQTASWKLYEIYRKNNNIGQALSYLEISSVLSNELFNSAKTGRVAELQLQYDNEKQLRAMHQLQLKQNKFIFIASILALLGIIGALIYYTRLKTRNTVLLKTKNKAIEQQNKQLAEHIAVLKQYSYAAAHDLKEPLRTITSFINLLERKYLKKIDEPEAQEYMHYIGNSARRMNLLLTDLLEYNSILSQEAGTESIKPIDSIQEVWTSLSALAVDKSAKLILPDSMPNIKMNKFHFSQLIQNLVSNGLKFTTNRDAEIKIGFEKRDNTCILSITDNGIGIKEEYKDKIFQMFYRLNDLKDAEGTGIGLTIVKNIIEKYHGRIWFHSAEGVGTTFYISFPNEMFEAAKDTKLEYSRSVAAAL